jgi:hypothetical protein
MGWQHDPEQRVPLTSSRYEGPCVNDSYEHISKYTKEECAAAIAKKDES